MRIKSIEIEGHPLFKSFSYEEFDLQTEPKDVVTFLIGQNGSGKSIFLEILVEIFQANYENGSLPYKYTLKYVLDNSLVTLRDGEIILTELAGSSKVGDSGGRKLSKKERINWLPNHVIFYYSGITERSRSYFENEFEATKGNIVNGKLVDLPRFFHINPSLTSLILITLYVFEDRFKSSSIWERLDLGDLGVISFSFNEVKWYEKNYNLEDANLDFWGARGSVGTFLDKLKSATASSKTASAEVNIDGKREKFLFYKDLVIDRRDISLLRRQFNDPKVFFKHLLDLNMSGLVQSVEVTLSKRDLKNRFSVTFLSEGEKQ